MTPQDARMSAEADVLVELGRFLANACYRFVTPTPETVRRFHERRVGAVGCTLRDAFGWSLPVEAEWLRRQLGADLLDRLTRARILVPRDGDTLRSVVRFSSLGGDLFVHSSYPTLEADAVFFGPDTYRFARFVGQEIRSFADRDDLLLVDVGCGSGAGGIAAKRILPAARVVLADISGKARAYARSNVLIAGVSADIVHSDLLMGVNAAPDIVIANPPYLVDERHRTYRDGGGPLGAELSLQIVRQSVERLRPGGRLVLYTASVIVDGEDDFLQAVRPIIGGHRYRYEEIDPDVFGEELDHGAYGTADRIAAVGLVIDIDPA